MPSTQQEPAPWQERGLPEPVAEAIAQLRAHEEADTARQFADWDIPLLQSELNIAELSGRITGEQARFLREKYLGYVYDENGELL